MPKPNRGKTIKLSIRLSMRARHNIEKQAENLGVSSAGIILFELAKILQNLPSISRLEEMEDNITLEKDHFVLTINEHLKDQIEDLSQDYRMKKNQLIGYFISDRFEKLDLPENDLNTDPKKLMLQVNKSLKKKMVKYSEDYYIPLSAIVSYSVLNGPSEDLPYYDEMESENIFTNVPEYIGEIIKEESEKRNMREHFYTSLCLYKQFANRNGRFFR